MKHKGIITQYMNPFYLCIMVVVVLVLLCVSLGVYVLLCFYLCQDRFEF